LAHEISHVVARDHYQALVLARNLAQAGGAARDMMARLPAFRGLANLTIDHATDVFGCALDQNAELGADRAGLLLAVDSGYAPGGFANVLRSLASLPRDDAQAALLFKTHPVPAERLAALAGVAPARMAEKSRAPTFADRFRTQSKD
jgi:predicted Zn-dependent protease